MKQFVQNNCYFLDIRTPQWSYLSWGLLFGKGFDFRLNFFKRYGVTLICCFSLNQLVYFCFWSNVSFSSNFVNLWRKVVCSIFLYYHFNICRICCDTVHFISRYWILCFFFFHVLNCWWFINFINIVKETVLLCWFSLLFVP